MTDKVKEDFEFHDLQETFKQSDYEFLPVGIIRTTLSGHPIENTEENLNQISSNSGISYVNPEAMRILGLGNHEYAKFESACLEFRYQDNRTKFQEIEEERGCG